MPDNAYAPRPEILAAVEGLCRGDLVAFIDRLWGVSMCLSDDLDTIRTQVLRARLNRESAAAWTQYEAMLASLKVDYPDGLPSAVTAVGAAARLDYLRRWEAANRLADRSAALHDRLMDTYPPLPPRATQETPT